MSLSDIRALEKMAYERQQSKEGQENAVAEEIKDNMEDIM